MRLNLEKWDKKYLNTFENRVKIHPAQVPDLVLQRSEIQSLETDQTRTSEQRFKENLLNQSNLTVQINKLIKLMNVEIYMQSSLKPEWQMKQWMERFNKLCIIQRK